MSAHDEEANDGSSHHQNGNGTTTNDVGEVVGNGSSSAVVTKSNSFTSPMTMAKKTIDEDEDVYEDVNNMSPTALKNAEYLDEIESTNDGIDTTSFQDIELPPPPPPNPNHDDIESNAGASISDPPESPRRAKKFYYCLPMIQRYKFALLGCVAVMFCLLLAIGLSARNLQKGEEALAAALGAEDQDENNNGGGDGDRGPIIINDAPPSDESYVDYSADVTVVDVDEDSAPGWDKDQEFLDPSTGEFGEEDLGDELEATATEFVQLPREEDEYNGPALPSGPSSHTSSLVDSPSITQPKWYQTSMGDYETYVESYLGDLDGIMHPYHIAGNFCSAQNLRLCSYNDYCPFDKGNAPYKGGPPTPEQHTWNTLEETQWAPFYSDERNELEDWVQVGKIPESDGGSEDDGYGRCYTYGRWSNGIGGTFDTEVTEEHRRWILCCPKEEEEGVGEGSEEVDGGEEEGSEEVGVP